MDLITITEKKKRTKNVTIPNLVVVTGRCVSYSPNKAKGNNTAKTWAI